MVFQRFTENLLRFRNQDLKQKVVTASTLFGAEMRYLIFVSVLIVVFGGTAMDLHLRKLAELKTLEIFLWIVVLVLYVILKILMHKDVTNKLVQINQILNTILAKLN